MRPNIDEYFLAQAKLIATRATCSRRNVGCVVVNSHNHVIATGYNGTPVGTRNCTEETPCPGVVYPSGEGLRKCEAVHAEQNALLQCADVWQITTMYTTTSPCEHCIKLLMNTSCQRIVFEEEYAHSDAKQKWLDLDREWIQIVGDEIIHTLAGTVQ